jgi:hypothetical protein
LFANDSTVTLAQCGPKLLGMFVEIRKQAMPLLLPTPLRLTVVPEVCEYLRKI